MSVVSDKAVMIIEHCIRQYLRHDTKKTDRLWNDRAYERVMFSWQLGMIDDDKKDSYLMQLGRVEIENVN